MLRLIIEQEELYDEENEKFLLSEEIVLDLEHSLASLSKWESEFKKPFLGLDKKTTEETLGYVKAMIITENLPENVVSLLNSDHLSKINEYIGSTLTATTFGVVPGAKQPPSREVVTSELIYFWMVTYNIPFECEHWHLSRLFALVKICNIKNSKQPKMSRSELAAKHRALNEERKAKYGTTG